MGPLRSPLEVRVDATSPRCGSIQRACFRVVVDRRGCFPIISGTRSWTSRFAASRGRYRETTKRRVCCSCRWPEDRRFRPLCEQVHWRPTGTCLRSCRVMGLQPLCSERGHGRDHRLCRDPRAGGRRPRIQPRDPRRRNHESEPSRYTWRLSVSPVPRRSAGATMSSKGIGVRRRRLPIVNTRVNTRASSDWPTR